MASGDLKVPFGLRDGHLFEPGNVVRGKECNCFCPDPNCNQPLVANHPRKSKIRPYFSHLHSYDGCGGVESAIHMMGKAVLAEGLLLELPDYNRAIEVEGMYRFPEIVSSPVNRTFEPVLYSNVVLEREIVTDIRPDAQVTVEGWDKPLLIEIKVTHPVEDQKAAALRKAGYKTIEIDLSGILEDFKKNGSELDRQKVQDQVHKYAGRTWVVEPTLDREYLVRHAELEALVRNAVRLSKREVVKNRDKNIDDPIVLNRFDKTEPTSNQAEANDWLQTNKPRLYKLFKRYLVFPIRKYPDAFSVSDLYWQMFILKQLITGGPFLPWDLRPEVSSLYRSPGRRVTSRIIPGLKTSDPFKATDIYLKELSKAGLLTFPENTKDYQSIVATVPFRSLAGIEEWIEWSAKKNKDRMFSNREFTQEGFKHAVTTRKNEILNSANMVKTSSQSTGFVCGCCNIYFIEPTYDSCPWCASRNEFVEAKVTDRYFQYLENKLGKNPDICALSVLKSHK